MERSAPWPRGQDIRASAALRGMVTGRGGGEPGWWGNVYALRLRSLEMGVEKKGKGRRRSIDDDEIEGSVDVLVRAHRHGPRRKMSFENDSTERCALISRELNQALGLPPGRG